MIRLKIASRAAGGPKRAIQIIKDTYVSHLCAEKDDDYGHQKVEHMTDDDYLAKAAKSGCFKLWFWLLVWAVLIGYVFIVGFDGLIKILSDSIDGKEAKLQAASQ